MANKVADKYGAKLYPLMADRKKPENKTIGEQFGRFSILSPEDYVLSRRGETPNHEQQFLTYLLWSGYDSIRRLCIDFYSKYIFQVGICASGGSDEALISKSHAAHFYAAWIPKYLAALRMEDDELRRVMARIIRMFNNAVKLLSNKKTGEVSAVGARFTTEADQRQETSRTFEFLRGENIKIPSTVSHAPSWLGLYCLMLAKEEFPDMFAVDFSSGHLVELPPLKNHLKLYRGPDFHFAKFMTTDKMVLPCVTAFSDYKTGAVIHGGIKHLASLKRPLGSKSNKEFWSEEEICPVRLDGPNVRVIDFPLARLSKE